MNRQIFQASTYSVRYVERRDVGREWNDILWNRNHPQIDCHRLYFLTAGRARIHLMDGTLELLPGYIYFIPAFSILQSEIDGHMNKYFIHFQADSPVLDLYRFLSGKYSVPADGMTQYLFETVLRYFAQNTQEAYMKVQGAMELLLSGFFSESEVNRHHLLKFDAVLRYVEENYRREIRLSELAELMNISTMYFSNLFKQVFHISPKQYILQKRLNEGQRLLLESELSIKEIAYAIGFENENYFSEFFSSKVGVSPRKFRNRRITSTPEDRSFLDQTKQ